MVVRSGIKSRLELEGDMKVVGEADNGLQVLSMLGENKLEVDVLLTDISMPGMDGLALTAEVSEKYPGIGIVILSMMDNEKYIYEAFNLGIRGYMLKNASVEEVLFAVRHVAQNNDFLCSELAVKMLKKIAKNHDSAPLFEVKFSSRELEILPLIGEGFTNEEIAEKTFTSRRTIEGHRQNMLVKSGVKNTAQLIKFACKAGLL